VIGDSYEARLRQLEVWQTGLDTRDLQVMLEVARLYLSSPLPGPGVRALGISLFEAVAAEDASARRELITLLRTGSNGTDKELAVAQSWLLTAAKAGDVEAMDRVASNYMNGSEGFSVDYPEARSWIEALIAHYRYISDPDAQAHIADLDNQLKYIDRLDQLAGGSLLGATKLAQLGAQTDAQAQYSYALQLLAGHGAKRRSEAVSRLQNAAELGHAEAAWRLVHIYERGFSEEINPAAAQLQLARAVDLHHFKAMRELAARYEYGKKGVEQNLPAAIEMYEHALAAGSDNRYNWNLDPDNFNHFRWLESRHRQAKLKLAAQ
jgi:TPR repeat protein